MRLIRLRLENFRQHTNTNIAFDEGMTAIVGANGAGKSTLLEGITFALYGKQRETQDTIRFSWGDKKKFLAAVEFEFDERRFEVIRSSAEASLVELTTGVGVTLAVGLGDTRVACERLLGLSYEQFKNSFSTVQKELAFLAFPNAKKQDEVGKMLGFDRVQRAEEIARKRRSTFQVQAEVLERSLGNLAELEASRKDEVRKLAAIRSRISDLQKALEKMEACFESSRSLKFEAENFQALSHEMDTIRVSADHLKENREKAKRALAEAAAQVKELGALRTQEQEFRRIEAEIRVWEGHREQDQARVLQLAELESLRNGLRELDEKIAGFKLASQAELDKTFKGAVERRDRAKQQLDEAQNEWRLTQSRAQGALAASSALASQSEAALARCHEMIGKGVCPECGQTIGKGYKEIVARFEAETVRLGKEQEATRIAADAASKRSTRLEKSIADLAALEGVVEEASSARQAAAVAHASAQALATERTLKATQAARLEATLANTPATYDAAKHEAAKKARQPLEAPHLRFLTLQNSESVLAARQKEHEEAGRAYEAAKARYKAQEAARAGLGVKSMEQATEAVKAHQELEGQLKALLQEAKHNGVLEELHAKSLDQAVKRIEEHKLRSQELAETQRKTALHDTAAKELRLLRENLNRTIGPELASRASENLNLLTNGRYTTLELDKDFEAKVVEDGVPKAVISGGEEDVVALALRIALSELIQDRQGRPMALLILDEVFGSLDNERRQSVLERLAALKGRFRQILVISHIEEINQVADRALYVRRDGITRTSTVTDAPSDVEGLRDLV